MKSLFRHLLFSACCLASIASHAVTADNGLVSVSSDSPSVRGILAVGDDFAVFRDRASAQAPATITFAGVGDMKVETPKVVPLGNTAIQYRAIDSRTLEDPAEGFACSINIDIEQDTVYVPYGNTATTLNLTDDSTWWRWDVIWSSEPAGISGRGPSITIPDNLRQGHYTVTAAFSENPDWNDTCNVEVVRVELTPKSVSGCKSCLNVTFSFVNSHIPGGVDWEISPDQDCTPPTISESGKLSVETDTGGEFVVKATSKRLSQCSDSSVVKAFGVTHSYISPDDDTSGYTDKFLNDGVSLYSQRNVNIYFLLAPLSLDGNQDEAYNHFKVGQLFKGSKREADGSYPPAPQIHGKPSEGGYNYTEWTIDSLYSDPSVNFHRDLSISPYWYHHDHPRMVPINIGTVGSLSFRTGVYCKISFPEDCNHSLPEDPIREESWRYYVRGTLGPDGKVKAVHTPPE